MEWTEDNLEKFIRENKDKFNTEDPSEYHGTTFFNKLSIRLHRIYISILPHLTKLAIISTLIFIISFFVWGNWINPDRDKKSLGSVSLEYRIKEIKYKYYVLNLSLRIRLNKDWCNVKDDMKNLDDSYDQLRMDLKKYPKDPRIISSMNEYYLIKIQTLSNFLQPKMIVQ